VQAVGRVTTCDVVASTSSKLERKEVRHLEMRAEVGVGYHARVPVGVCCLSTGRNECYEYLPWKKYERGHTSGAG
jgi:hypothetical protein